MIRQGQESSIFFSSSFALVFVSPGLKRFHLTFFLPLIQYTRFGGKYKHYGITGWFQWKSWFVVVREVRGKKKA